MVQHRMDRPRVYRRLEWHSPMRHLWRRCNAWLSTKIWVYEAVLKFALIYDCEHLRCLDAVIFVMLVEYGGSVSEGQTVRDTRVQILEEAISLKRLR